MRSKSSSFLRKPDILSFLLSCGVISQFIIAAVLSYSVSRRATGISISFERVDNDTVSVVTPAINSAVAVAKPEASDG